MSQLPPPPRFPRWIKALGWFCLILVGIACLGVIGVRLMMWRMQGKVAEAVALAPKPISADWHGVSSSTKNGSPAATAKAPQEIPHLGPVFSGEEGAVRSFAETINALRDILDACGPLPKEGPIDFRAVLLALGVDLPAGATDAEAASLFLERTSGFAAFLEQWKAAVTAGPWDTSGATGPLDYLSSAFSTIPRLLRLMAEAHWQAGDPASAWDTAVLLSHTTDRAFDVSRLHSQSAGYSSSELMAQTLAGGLVAGVWSDDQLRAMPSLAASLDPLGKLPSYTEGITNTLNLVTQRGAAPPASAIRLEITDPLGSVISMAHGVMNSSRQRWLDNQSLIEAGLRADVASFDVEKRALRPAVERGPLDPTKHMQDDWFTSLYFSPAWAFRDFGDETQTTVGRVVSAQSQLDLSAIAAQLELEKRATGSYPDRLPDGVPDDVATGQSYRYERLPAGGYRLWGLGLDQSDQGGDVRSDVVWPVGTMNPP